MEHSAAFLKIVDDAKALIKELTIAQTRARIANDATIKLIDVREDREWTLGHISGAEHIGKGVIERDIETKIPDKSAEIILYCGGGFRSALAAETLQKWDTPTCTRWMAAGASGRTLAIRSTSSRGR